MNKEFINKPLLLVIYPYHFHDFEYNRMELYYFERYCDVFVWDISPITTPNFSKKLSTERCKKNNVIVISSLLDFVRRVSELRKRTITTNICIVNEASASNSLFEFICNLIIIAFLRNKNMAILELYNGGLPLGYTDGIASSNDLDHKLGFFAKALRFAKDTSSLSETKKKISEVLFARLSRLLPAATTHRLVAGEDFIMLAQRKDRRKNLIRLVNAHSNDYSKYLLHKMKFPTFVEPHNKIAVLLDGAVPMFGSDSALLGRKVYLTTDVWYPALSRFFDRLEAETGVNIEIAGHYKTILPAIAPCFGNRPVHYDKTMELVRSSEFVITRASTAVSYAVIFRKPVIFIYSNQLKKDRMAMRDIYGMAAMLGNEPVNIDEPNTEIKSLLKVNEERYLNYENVCLTSTKSQRPNFQIILEDIMNITIGSEFYRESLNAE